MKTKAGRQATASGDARRASTPASTKPGRKRSSAANQAKYSPEDSRTARLKFQAAPLFTGVGLTASGPRRAAAISRVSSVDALSKTKVSVGDKVWRATESSASVRKRAPL
jgi:hypothetical protein